MKPGSGSGKAEGPVSVTHELLQDARDAGLQSAAFAIEPELSTNQRSLTIGLPAKRSAIQSATSVGGCGPRLTEGHAPIAWRAS